jgi:serine/threonine protein kinase
MAEMYTHPQPLFCGSNEKEVLFRICSILGTPTHDTWNDGIRQANIIGMKFPTCPGTDLEKVIPGASAEAIDLMKQMIQWDPNKRATAKNLLKHPFFTNHTIDNYYYSSGNNDIIFGENSFKKFSNSNDRGRKNEIKKHDKESNNNSSSNNDNNINGFGLDDNENFGNMLNESDGFDKLLNQLKMEKIEEDRSYEKQKKQKIIETQKEKEKLKEEEYDIDNLINNFNNTNNKDEISKKDKLDDNLFNKGGLYENKEFNFSNEDNIKINKEQNNDIKFKQQNRRGNARQFLEETENGGGFNLYNGFNENIKKKSSENTGNNDFGNFNIGNSGEFGSLFGNKSRRRHDKNYEI